MVWRLRRRVRSQPREQEETGRDIKAYYGYRPGSWGEIALPPQPLGGPARRYDVVLESTQLPVPKPRVRLGFVDGTELELDETSRESQELSRVAETLTEAGSTR